MTSGLLVDNAGNSYQSFFRANYHVGKEFTCIFGWSYRDWMWVTGRLYIRWWPSHACWWPHTTPYMTRQCGGAHHTPHTLHYTHQCGIKATVVQISAMTVVQRARFPLCHPFPLLRCCLLMQPGDPPYPPWTSHLFLPFLATLVALHSR